MLLILKDLYLWYSLAAGLSWVSEWLTSGSINSENESGFHTYTTMKTLGKPVPPTHPAVHRLVVGSNPTSRANNYKGLLAKAP